MLRLLEACGCGRGVDEGDLLMSFEMLVAVITTTTA